MKLRAIEESSLVALFLLGRKDAKTSIVEMAVQLAARYQFQKGPQQLSELTADKVVFELGSFDGVTIQAFEIYNDGIVVKAFHNSDVLDRFVDDLKAWIEAELGGSVIETHAVNRMYTSRLMVEMNDHALHILDGLSSINEMITSHVENATGQRAEFLPFGFITAPDESLIAGMKPIPFRLERRNGLGFATKLFFSAAPLKTDAHIEVLNAIERL